MYSISYLSRQVEALRRRLKPALAILKLRNLAMEFCDEFDAAASGEAPRRRDTLFNMSAMFIPRVGQAGFRLDTFQDLMDYFARCIRSSATPDPRDIVFTLIPWARKGPILRPDLWERPEAA